ncbi:MAG: dynamin family protein [Oscillospiraceae bacterium]
MAEQFETTPARSEQDIAEILGCLQTLIGDGELGAILGSDFTDGLKFWDTTIRKRCEEPFTLVILGDFKRGKSTIINAILGKELAPVNVSPETYTINEISYGEEQSVEAVLTTGARVPLELDDIVRERIEVLIKTLPAGIDHLDIRDSSPILKEIRIVDTPGLSDLDDLDRQVSGYLVNADAIIYVASALMPFSESEQMYLISRIQPQRFGMLYVLVNMVDALGSRKDVDKILARFSQISEQIVPNAFVYGISGGDEIKRKLRRPRLKDKGFREYYETEFFKFELSLRRDIILQKDVIRTRRVLNLLKTMLSETKASIAMYAEMTALGKKNFETLSEDFQRECETLSEVLAAKKPILHISIVEMQQEAERWMYEFFAVLRESVLACRGQIGETLTAEEVEKYFYSFLMDKVGEAYRCAIEVHQQRINRLVDDLSVQLAKKLGISNLAEVSQAAPADKLMLALNKKITRSVMDVKLFGTSETFPPETMTSFRDIMKRKKQTTDVINIVLENYDDIRANIVKDIKTAYQEFENKAFERLDGIYHAQAEVGKQSLLHAAEMMGSYDPDQTDHAFKQAAARLTDAEALLEKYGLEEQ